MLIGFLRSVLGLGTMVKTIRTREELRRFECKISEALSVPELEAVVSGFSFFDVYKELVLEYLSIHEHGEIQGHGSDLLRDKVKGLSSTIRTAVSLAFQKHLSLRLRYVDRVEYERYKDVLKVVGESDKNKALFLKEVGEGEKYSIGATFFSRGGLVKSGVDGNCFYIVSLKTPVDAIYFPAEDIVVWNPVGVVKPVEINYFLSRFFGFFCVSYERFLAFYGAGRFEKDIVQVARVDRPYHVFADELSGNYILSEVMGSKIPIAFSGEASFFEAEEVLYEKSSCSIDFERILFCYQKRLKFGSAWGDEYLSLLLRKSEELYGFDGGLAFEGKNVVWITLTGGEKPRLKNELEFIGKVIEFFESRFTDVFYVFDGYTKAGIEGQKGYGFIEYHRKVAKDLVFKYGLDGRFASLIGEGVYKKIYYSQFCDYVVSSGTPLVWSSNFSDAFCMVHGSKEALQRVGEFTRSKNILLLDGQCKSWEDDSEGVRFDRVSYSLDLDYTLDFLSEKLGA